MFPLTISIEIMCRCQIYTAKFLGKQAVTTIVQLYALPGYVHIPFDTAFKTFSVCRALKFEENVLDSKYMHVLSFIDI